MKNLKVSMKLLVAFLIVILLSALIGGVGIYGMFRITDADADLYENKYLPTVLAGDISQQIVEQRAFMRGLVIYDVNTDAEEFQENETGLAANRDELDEMLEAYDPTITNPDDREIFDEFTGAYRDEWVPLVDRISELGQNNQTEDAKIALTEAARLAAELDQMTTALQQTNLSDGEVTVGANRDLFTRMTWIEIAALVLSVVIALFLVFLLTRLIARPMIPFAAFMRQAGEAGDTALSQADQAMIADSGSRRDEIGQMISAASLFIGRIIEISRELEAIAAGDLTAEVLALSDRDTLGISLQKMTRNLNEMFSEVNTATSQFSTEAGQVADGAQALASGTTQQAATIEELSGAISEIADRTQANAMKAESTSRLGGTIKENAEKGTRQMSEMVTAVRDINEASQSISRVIKTINDIAFQTNILALNASVEAAHAGQYGKGFAVVADEVRNLAAKSAEAAKDTEGLIADSLSKAELGVSIAEGTSARLDEIVAGINESSALVAEIAKTSDEQSQAIAQINVGIDQVAQVVQQNSATAEENAAVAEEMSSQSDVLRQRVARFKIRDDRKSLSPPAGRKRPASALPPPESAAPRGSYGKY